MSDTPKTDAIDVPSPLAREQQFISMRNLCRELERELRVARERYDYVRGLNVPEFQRLFTLCIHGERFDDLVDEDIRDLQDDRA